jgi:hypothetical protein
MELCMYGQRNKGSEGIKDFIGCRAQRTMSRLTGGYDRRFLVHPPHPLSYSGTKRQAQSIKSASLHLTTAYPMLCCSVSKTNKKGANIKFGSTS